MTRREPRYRAWDDYLIPGTSVLRNMFVGPGKPYGETDQTMLTQLEEQRTRLRLVQLHSAPVPGLLGYDHMKAIHRHVFQDVYEWAGEERTAPDGWMVKDGHRYYPAGPALTAAAEAEYAKIAEADRLRGMDRHQFVAELAERWGELNVIHSFREGNTRTQFAFFTQLCAEAGYRLGADAFRPRGPLRDAFVQARFHSQDTGSNAELASVLDEAITVGPDRPGSNVTARSATHLRMVEAPPQPSRPLSQDGQASAQDV